MPIRLHVLASAARHAVSSSVLVFRLIAFHLTPLLLHLSYFLAVDLLGSLALVLLRPSSPGSYRLRYVDVFFMSTSAVTVTGLATVQMEDLSSAQLVVLTLLMLLGSEMFVSLLDLVLESSRKRRQQQRDHQHHDGRVMTAAVAVCDEPDLEEANGPAAAPSADSSGDGGDRKESCGVVRSLALVVSAYMAAILVVGSVLVFAYVATVPTARDVLARKGISAALFSVSTTVSSFTNGGLLPTNESMAVFAANRGLLLLLAAQILAGSTLLPVFLRLAVSATRGLARVLLLFTGRGGPVEELVPMDMENSAAAAGFGHLLPSDTRAASLAVTVVAVAAAAAALLCCLNWNSPVFAGLTAGEKVTNAVFMAVNVRQAGENSVDCSLVAPAVLVLFLAMMCIPASATLLSVHDDGGEKKMSGAGEPERKDGEKKRRLSLNSMLLSPLACNAAAVMLACITERRSISGDPLNFSTFNVIFEVISAYGNVGLSTGYSCSRLLPAAEATATCHDKPYSFSGWWSDQGKLLLVLLMLYGRLKGFQGQRRRR
ncbi:cation transporter HKT2;4-like [Miscanthus floridulus]|uniref:cation transporter HKT2;4-like n=1 Tax=Miscanthus floridulus TaxID=154761 RepID=UPI003458273B